MKSQETFYKDLLKIPKQMENHQNTTCKVYYAAVQNNKVLNMKLSIEKNNNLDDNNIMHTYQFVFEQLA